MSQPNTQKATKNYQSQFDENYQPKFDEIFVNLKTNPVYLDEFYKNPQLFLHAAGIPVLNSPLMNPNPMSNVQSNGIDLKQHWWGQQLTMNEDVTQKIIEGHLGSAELAALLCVFFEPHICAAFGIAFVIKVIEIKLVNNGKGVHWPITWPQWAGMIATDPLIFPPPMLAASIAIWLHPFRN